MATYGVVWPEDWRFREEVPTDGQIFDLIEFSYEHIAKPNPTRSTRGISTITTVTTSSLDGLSLQQR